MTAKHKFLCKRIGVIICGAKLRLKMLIIIDNMYIEISSILNQNDHEIRNNYRCGYTLFFEL